MSAKALTLAIPSKGRLQEQVTQYFADAGMAAKQSGGSREYRASLIGQPEIEVKLMSSGEIATALAAGDIHLGITGEDLIRESMPDGNRTVVSLQALGFGFADVVVAVPRAWIDVSTMTDLDDVCTAFHMRHHRRLKVATKYMTLTRAFFAAHGISDYRIIESLGATEGAPGAGLAEAIVDITTTGSTLAANDLKVLDDGVILKSQAQLAASLKSEWSKAALDAADRLTARIAARETARGAYVLKLDLSKDGGKILAALEKELDCTVLSRSGVPTVLCRREALSDAVALLRRRGVKAPVAAEPVDYVFGETNPLLQRLTSALKP